MTLDFRNRDIPAADQSTATDTGADTGGGGGGGGSAGKPTVTDLGNGYSLVSWTDENGLAKSSIVPNKDAASVAAVEAAKIAAGGVGVSASITTAGANQRAAVQAEIDRAKNAADQAHQAAMDALAQGNAAEARRQFDISSAELQRYHTLDTQIRQQEANTAATSAGYNIYKDLTDKASNPRNFMEQFFKNRGQAAPPGSAAYGNTAMGPQGIMPFEKWLPNFMSQTLGSYGSPSSGAGAASPAASASPSPAAPNMGIPVGAGGAISDWARTHGYSAAGAAPTGGSPNTADTAMIGGVKTWAGGPYSGRPVDQSPANAGDLTPYLKNPNLPDPTGRVPQQFAGGGTLRMTAPHAIVNMLSGRVAAVAGEQPGRGPQGFVPEKAKFSGQAIVAPLDSKTVTEPAPPDGTVAPSPDPAAIPLGGFGAAVGAAVPAAGAAAGVPVGQAAASVPAASAFTDPALSSVLGTFNPSSIAAPAGFHWVGSQLVPDTSAPAPATQTPAPTPTTQTPTVIPPMFNSSATIGSTPTTVTPPPTTFGPSINPGGSNPWGGPITTPPNPANPPQATTPGWDFTQTPSGLGQNPTFLPEDAAAKDPILAQMLAAGSFPPFLQRLYAQAKGLPGLGTNVPQTTNLPNDVPLVSQLALNQMSPSEFQAFQSFLSAHGIDWNDYVSMVQAASPQGGTSPKNPAVPKFLGQ